MMKTSSDPEADAFSTWFAPEGVTSVRTDEVSPGILIDFDADGRAIGIEILSVGLRLDGSYPAGEHNLAAAE